jgi:hypothetical protein
MRTPDSHGPQGLADPLADELRKYFADSIIPYVRESAAEAATKAVDNYIEGLAAEQARIASQVDHKLGTVATEVETLRTETAKLYTASTLLEQKRQEIQTAIDKVTEEAQAAHAELLTREAADAAARAREARSGAVGRNEDVSSLVAAVRELIATLTPEGDEAAGTPDKGDVSDAAPRPDPGVADDEAADDHPVGAAPAKPPPEESNGRLPEEGFFRGLIHKTPNATGRADDDSPRGEPQWKILARRHWKAAGVAVVCLVAGFSMGALLPPFHKPAPSPDSKPRPIQQPIPSAEAEIEAGWNVVKERAPDSVCVGATTCATFASAWGQDRAAQSARLRIVQLLVFEITGPGGRCDANPEQSQSLAAAGLPPPKQPDFDGIWGPNLSTSLVNIGQCLDDKALSGVKPAEPTPANLRAYSEILLKALGKTNG